MKKIKRKSSTSRKAAKTSKLILFLWILLGIAAVVYAYPRVMTFFSNQSATPTAIVKKDLSGVYVGTLPCADCPGIETILTLNPDMTYEMVETYQDRDAVFTSGGHWTYSAETFQITLTEAERSYLLVGDSLEMLNLQGERIRAHYNLMLRKIK